LPDGVIETEEHKTVTAAGLSKIETRAKLRFYYDYQYGKRDQAVLIAGVRWPTVTLNKELKLANNSIDFVTGIAMGREALKKSYFGAISYILKTKHQSFKEGNELKATLSGGFRPLRIDFYKLDWMFFLELDGLFKAHNQKNNVDDKNSGGYVVFAGPVVVGSLQNCAFKAGVQAPIIEHLYGQQHNHHLLRFALGFDLHF